MENIDPAELSKQLKKPTGKLGHAVAQELNESNKYLYKLAWEIANLESAEHLLEIGFGNGSHLSRYFDFNSQLYVTGIDFSEDMCREARSTNSNLIKDGRLTVRCADSSSIPARDHSFDLIVGLNIVYFWDPPEPYFKEICRVLKPDGKLLLGYRPRHAVEHLEFTKQNFILYEPDELDALISANGMKVIRQETKTYTKQAINDNVINITDICLLAERM